ncbi:hypothetical protein EON64_08280 [archaeon]|nr:MAG: hypothetical protein EON64_08280 [archaeon]
MIQVTEPDTELSLQLTNDKLICIVDEAVPPLSYVGAFMCILPMPSWMLGNCDQVFGSRSLVLDVQGSVEIIRVSHKPVVDPVSGWAVVNASRWLHFGTDDDADPSEHRRELAHLPAEPTYLCARSDDWTERRVAHLRLQLRHVFSRESDRQRWVERLGWHSLLLALLCSPFALPYLVAAAVAVFVFQHGLHKIMVLGALSGGVLCLTPLMLTQDRRHLARHYLNYFFTRVQLEETRALLRHRRPLFQALYFAAALLALGCCAVHLGHQHLGVSREHRNLLLRAVLAASLSWLAFFVSRSFERFLTEWVWVLVSVLLTQGSEERFNPSSRDQVRSSVLLLSFLLVQATGRLRRSVQHQDLYQSLREHVGRLGWRRTLPLKRGRSSAHNINSATVPQAMGPSPDARAEREAGQRGGSCSESETSCWRSHDDLSS